LGGRGRGLGGRDVRDKRCTQYSGDHDESFHGMECWFLDEARRA
jgi:hypothetical protein